MVFKSTAKLRVHLSKPPGSNMQFNMKTIPLSLLSAMLITFEMLTTPCSLTHFFSWLPGHLIVLFCSEIFTGSCLWKTHFKLCNQLQVWRYCISKQNSLLNYTLVLAYQQLVHHKFSTQKSSLKMFNGSKEEDH